MAAIRTPKQASNTVYVWVKTVATTQAREQHLWHNSIATIKVVGHTRAVGTSPAGTEGNHLHDGRQLGLPDLVRTYHAIIAVSSWGH